MGKKKIIFLIVFFMAISMFVPRLDVNAAASDLQILFNNNGNTATSSNMINANFKVVNNGTSSINLADLKIRYFYTADSDKAQNFFCDHAGMLDKWTYTGVTDKVTGTFVKMSPSMSTADTYLEVGFKSGAGTLSAGGYIEIQTRVARTDWTNYDLSNDYSFNTFSTYGENDNIAVYLSGNFMFGVDPSMQTPSIMPTVFTHDKYINSELSVTLTPNGNLFNGIVGLIQGKDYEVAGNTVTLKKEYLNSLALGITKLTFEFGSSTYSPTLTLTVKDTTPKPKYDAIIGTATGMPGDTVTVPVSFKNVAQAGNVGVGDFYIKYDNTLLEAISVAPGSIVTNPVKNFSGKIDSGSGTISLVFLDNTIGDELIKTDGDFALITFKIKDTATITTTPLKFLPLEFGSGANMTDGSITITRPELEPQINPSQFSYLMYDERDIAVTLTPNGHTFFGIRGLTEGVDYTVSGNIVTILESYIRKLPSGTKSLIFDFGVTKNPTFTISGVYCPCCGVVEIGTAKGALDDTVTVPITVKDFRYLGGIGTFNFYVNYDKTLLEAVSVNPSNLIKNPDINFSSRINTTTGLISLAFIDNTLGEEIINSNGVLLNITFKILGTKDTITPIVFKDGGAFGNRDMAKILYIFFKNGSVTIDKTNTLDLSVGKVTGKEGETVAVPISFANVATMGNVMSCNFKVSYDTNLLEAVSVEPGSIVTNAGANFSANISTTSGAISLFLDSTEENQSISEDGVFAYINFKLKTPTAAQIKTPVEINNIGAFSDLNLNKMLVTTINGDITIIRTTIPDTRINPSMVTYDLGSTSYLSITLDLNSNTFKGITGLRSGTDYTVSQNTVTIFDTYMNSLKVGTHKLTFDFDLSDKNPVLEIAVKAGTPTLTTNYIKVDKNNPKDMTVNINPNGNTFNGIVGLKEGVDYTVSGNTVTILTSYMSSLETGTKEITFDFGVTKNPVFIVKIIDTDKALLVRAGVATVTPGDTVTIPVTFAGVSNVGGVGTCNFYIGYDKSQLEVVSVTAGDIITNAGVNFASKIDLTKGVISFVFLDNTIGEELIKQDGVFANIKFKKIGYNATNSPIKFNEGGAFGNANFIKIENVITEDGSINTYYY